MSESRIYDELSDAEDLDTLGLTEEELKAVRPEADADGDDVSDDDGAVDETPEPDDVEPDDEDAKVEAEEEANPEPPREIDTTFVPKDSADSTEGLSEKMQELSAEFTELSDKLASQYESGDLSFSEYRKADRELSNQYDSQRDQIAAAILKAEIAAEHSQQSSAQKWELEQQMFYQDNPEYKTDAVMRGALSAQLEALYDDEANAGRSGLWFLREAGRMINERFSMKPSEPTAGNKALDDAANAMRKKAAKPLNSPKTLADIPAADVNDDGGEFAYIDKLNGLAYERAIAKLSPDQYERFMAA